MRWQKTALLVLLKGRLVGRAKPNVPFVRRQFKIFCAVGKKIKHSRVGNECRLTRCPFVISFLCLWSPVKIVYFSIYFSRFVVVVSFFTLAGNGWLAAVPSFVGLAGWLFGGMDSQPLLCVFCHSCSKLLPLPIKPNINLILGFISLSSWVNSLTKVKSLLVEKSLSTTTR